MMKIHLIYYDVPPSVLVEQFFDEGAPVATVAQITYDVLRARGLTTMFGNPGSNELPFLKDMPDDFRYVLGLHEGAVIGMADGYAQATGHPTFVNLHAASGTGNAMGGLTNAVYAHSPIVVTAGQQVRSTVGQEVMLANIDASALPRPLVKWSYEPTCATDVPRAVDQAVHTAALAPRGPVYLSIPYDDWGMQADDQSAHLLSRRVSIGNELPGEQVAELVTLLREAASPVLVLGPQVDVDRAQADAVRLAELLRAPVWIAPSAPRCPFPTRHPSFRGQLPASIRGLGEAVAGHDVVLVVGAPVFRYHQYEPGELLPAGARLVQITADPGEAARAPMGEAVVAGAGAALAVLADNVPASDLPPLPALPDFPEPRTAPGYLHPDHLCALLRQHAPPDTVYVNESTSTGASFWSQMDLSEPGSYYFPASGGLGFGLPAAVGAQFAHPGRQVVGFIGDGSANYGITALWTAARYRIPVIVLILKNGTYGALRWFGELLGTGETPGLDVPGIDFVKVAEGYGVPARSVDSAEGFVLAFKDGLAADGPVVIEVVTANLERGGPPRACPANRLRVCR